MDRVRIDLDRPHDLSVGIIPILMGMGLVRAGISPSGWYMATVGLLWNLVVPFVVGSWIGRPYPGREAATSFFLMAIHMAINIVIAVALLETVRNNAAWHPVWSIRGVYITGPGLDQRFILGAASPLVYLLEWPLWMLGALVDRAHQGINTTSEPKPPGI